MRHPLRKAGLCAALVIVGVAVLLFAVSQYQRLGPALGGVVGFLGLFLAIMSFAVLIWCALAAIGYARLRAGKGIIARWHITPAEWERFRAFDSLRAAQDLTLRNDFHIRPETRPAGVDVIVGRRQLIVDGSYHSLRRLGSPSLRQVGWLPAPADPECLEFALEYPRGRFGGTFTLSLRLPVPASARADGVRVFEHYRALTPPPRR